MSRMPRKVYDLDADLLRQIEDFRFENRIRSEVEAVRRLLEIGIRAAKKDAARER